jgi:chromosome segregation ATPase
LIESYDGYFAPDTIISVSIPRAHWLKISAEVAQLRSTLSLAEEGLANYEEEMQARIKLMAQKDEEIERLRACRAEALENYAKQNAEIQRLQRALNFWLPKMPAGDDDTSELFQRLGDDIALLVGYDGEMEAEAEERGWVTLNAQPQEAKHG